MNNEISNLELSYKMQSENFMESDEESARMRKSWFDEDTVDHWRHHRMITPLAPLLDRFPSSSWLTVGDGRYGLDSVQLKKMKPSIETLPTDLSTVLLQEAKEMKIISDYRKENAEALSFADNSFDFSFCKEAYHHFPRPYIAIYEMLRVSKKAIVFIEPNDKIEKKFPEVFLNAAKARIKKIFGRTIHHTDTWSFEESGNYIYMVSKREMEKVALALQLPTVAFYFYNDYYEPGVEFEKAVPGNKLFEKVKKIISRADLKSRLGIRNYSSIVAIVFKQRPEKELKIKLQEAGFEVIDLPENPYLKKRKEELVNS